MTLAPKSERTHAPITLSASSEEAQRVFRDKLSTSTRNKLSAALGVSVQSLEALCVGFTDERRPAFTLPMRNADGEIVGFRQRFLSDMHAKRCIAGGHLGLFIPQGVTPGNCELICEGESDTAAALTHGLTAIGVPGAGEGADEAGRFFAKSAVSCPCIVADSDDVGLAGAEKLKDALLMHGVPCKLLSPPGAVKDLREWFADGVSGPELRATIAHADTCRPKKWPYGFYMLPHAAVRRGIVKQIGCGPMVLALAIASFTGKDRTGFAEREVLAELCGVSVSQIDRWKRTLANAGILSWERGHKGKANVYRLDFGPLLKFQGRLK